MIANLRTARRFPLVATAVAIIVLVQAMMVIPAWACVRDHDSGTAASLASDATQHQSGNSDCEKSSSQSPMQHNDDCRIDCISMTGCGAPSLMAQQTIVGLSLRESGDPLTLVIAYTSRSLVPDRPPPRS